MKTKLTHAASAMDAPLGHVWRSKPVHASLFRLLWFAMASGDWSRTHANPFTALLYRSNLGGAAFCIDSVLAMTKARISRLFGLGDSIEIIASGYDSVVFKRPVRLGARFSCRFTLRARTAYSGKTWCKWDFEVIDANDSKIFCFGTFKAGFFPVERSSLGAITARIQRPCLYLGSASVAAALVLLIGSAINSFHRPTWYEQLALMSPSERNWYLEGDAKLLTVVRQIGNVKDLKYVGTKRSVEWLLDGP